MLNKTWRVVLLAVIIGFSLWWTMYSSWIILAAAVLLLVFEVACRDSKMSKASKTASMPAKSKARRSSRRR